MNSLFASFGLALAGTLALVSPATASEPTGAVFASSYWSGFIDHWQNVFEHQNGIGMFVVAVGVVALFIITRGKWQK
jgi:hypothetical protein